MDKKYSKEKSFSFLLALIVAFYPNMPAGADEEVLPDPVVELEPGPEAAALPNVGQNCQPHPGGVESYGSGTMESPENTVTYSGDTMVSATYWEDLSKNVSHRPGGSAELHTTKVEKQYVTLERRFSYSSCLYEDVYRYFSYERKENTLYLDKTSGRQKQVYLNSIFQDSERKYQNGVLLQTSMSTNKEIDQKTFGSFLPEYQEKTSLVRDSVFGDSKVGYQKSYGYDRTQQGVERLCFRKVIRYKGSMEGVEDVSQSIDNCPKGGAAA